MSVSVGPGGSNNYFKNAKNDFEIDENEEIWRKHEKSQISYIQNQNAKLLASLHDELERLQNINRDLERRLYVSGEKEELENIRSQLIAERQTTAELRRELALSAKRSGTLAQTLEKTAILYKEQIAQHEDKIRQLNEELKRLSLQNTYFSTHLRNARLRSAVIQAHQNRKSLRDFTRTLSPTSPLDSSDSKDEMDQYENERLKYKYHHLSHSPQSTSSYEENNIERPGVRRSLTSSNSPLRPSNLPMRKFSTSPLNSRIKSNVV